jgi:hypothetical protein
MRTTNAGKLFALFGSAAALAREIGVTRATVSRWDWPSDNPRGHGGIVPTEYYQRIRDAAERLGPVRGEPWIAAVLQCLPLARCPACGEVIEGLK